MKLLRTPLHAVSLSHTLRHVCNMYFTAALISPLAFMATWAHMVLIMSSIVIILLKRKRESGKKNKKNTNILLYCYWTHHWYYYGWRIWTFLFKPILITNKYQVLIFNTNTKQCPFLQGYTLHTLRIPGLGPSLFLYFSKATFLFLFLATLLTLPLHTHSVQLLCDDKL